MSQFDLSFDAMIKKYLDYMKVRNYSERTVHSSEYLLVMFKDYCAERAITKVSEVTKSAIQFYQRHLYLWKSLRGGGKLAFSTQSQRIRALSPFFGWLARENYILYNPAGDIELPRREYRLPMEVLSVEEMEKVLAVPNLNDPFGLNL